MALHRTATTRTLIFAAAAGAAWVLAAPQAGADALILVDVEGGKVLHAENATAPWYPASITKIMTAYVTLRAVKEGRLTIDKLLTVSHNAAAQSPVKMGFPPGTTVTVDNALKMLMVKSANDMAVVLAEGVAGSVERFADVMNLHAQRLGMTQSHFVNPNGLPADDQVTSARDMAMLARQVIREFPEYDHYWRLPGIRFGKKVQRNYNTLIGRYPGADGMKTGFICASGFNLVATASRDGKRLIAVVLGAPSSSARAIKAAQLLERGFTSNPLAWLTPALGTVDGLKPVDAAPPNLREEMCGKHRKRQATEDEDDSAAIASLSSSADSAYSVFLSALRAPNGKQNLLQQEARLGEPVVVFTGPPKKKQATADAKGKDGGKVKTGAAKAGIVPAAATSVPWTNTSPGSLADTPPPELAAKQGGGSGNAVPVPRVKPKSAATKSAAAQPTPKSPSPKTGSKTSSKTAKTDKTDKKK
jgi:D-alanyl-D-alanine carboxypeptidase